MRPVHEFTGELLRGVGPDLGPLATRFPVPERTLLHVMRLQAQERGDQEWLRFDNVRSVTYAEAYTTANRVAHAVLEASGERAHVGIFLRNQAEFFGAFYGAMASGGVAIPLNADAHGPILQHLVEASDVSIMVVRADLVHRFVDLDSIGLIKLFVVVGDDAPAPDDIGGAPVVRYDDWIRDSAPTAPRPLPDSACVGAIMFTSGTTGNSKGVVLPHHFLYMYSVASADSVGFTPDDVLFAATPLYHALALHTISNAALHAGARAHLRSRFSADTFWEQVAEAGATYMVILGPMAQILTKTAPDPPPHRVRLIYCVPYPPNGDEFCRRFNVKAVWQGFGMTEIFPNPPFDHDTTGVPTDSAGFPSSWVEYGIVDQHDRVLPFGEVGQLVFRPRLPDVMARGYYKNPEVTVEAFRNMMFHTGDLATADETGRIFYRGRMNDRIRRRGENVSAAEIESVVVRHDAVVEAAAYAVPGDLGEDEIKLDVVAVDGGVDVATLYGWLVAQLPRYTLPRYVEVCAELPKTPSGKIQKHELAARPLSRTEVHEFEPPRRA